MICGGPPFQLRYARSRQERSYVGEYLTVICSLQAIRHETDRVTSTIIVSFYRKNHCPMSEFHVKFHAKNRYRTHCDFNFTRKTDIERRSDRGFAFSYAILRNIFDLCLFSGRNVDLTQSLWKSYYRTDSLHKKNYSRAQKESKSLNYRKKQRIVYSLLSTKT